MARATAAKPKRRTAAPPCSEELRAILLKLPPDLVAEIDALAAADRRPRTKMIEVMLVEAVQRYQRRSAA
jgi:hypothetical protein